MTRNKSPSTRVALASAMPLLAGACAAVPPPADPARAPFPTLAFFAGETAGRGMLHLPFRRQPVAVAGHGRLEADGTLVLDQEVRQGHRPPRHRSWHIREVAPGRIAGTLTDAAGPVCGEAAGGRLHLRFPMKGGIVVEQWLVLDPDRRTARNLLVGRLHGIPLARLEEVIVRAAPLP